MKKLLYITNRLKYENKNGAYLASKRNYEALLEQDILIEKNIIPTNNNKIKELLKTFIYNRLEITPDDEKRILKKLKKEQYDIIFLDGSGFGYLSDKIKKIDKNIKIITFCHDINYYFYCSLSEIYKKKLKWGIKSIYRYLVIKKNILNSIINEKKIFKNSDIIITFNKRDSKLLMKKYNKKADLEIPMSFKNNDILCSNIEIKTSRKFKLLFIGIANHLPNIEGIEFFLKNVISEINVELLIIGKGMEKYKNSFEKFSNKVKVIGTVENLSEYYIKVDAVISPIFSGGGMKIKTGEALSYGKTIFGTREAFEGYELDYKRVGGMCNTSEEFIKNINDYIGCWERNGKPKFNEYSYKIYKEKYSYSISIKKFKEVLNKIGN